MNSKWIHKITTSLPAPTRKLPVPNKTAAATLAAVVAGAALWWLSSAPPAPAPTPPAAPADATEPAQAQPLTSINLPPPPYFTTDPNTWPQIPQILEPILPTVTEPPATPTPDDQPETPPPDTQDPEPSRQSWIVLDPTRYPLNAQVVDHYTALPQAYAWPLPDFNQLELICHDNDEHPHLGILEAPDGRLFNWGDERRFLTDDLERDRIESSELATIAFPGAFLEPLRAAAHAVCAQAHDDRLTETDD